jgi:uncharacterized C2H2 Zn-finger protein
MYVEKRFRVLGVPAIYRKRVNKTRGWKFEKGSTFNMLHMGKRSLLWEKSSPDRGLWNW